MGDKSRVLLVGCGGIGTISALNLETGGLAAVTAVLRSNYDVVKANGFDIRSVDHGKVDSFRPTEIVQNVPNVAAEGLEPFQYIICTTKNVADIKPTVADIIRPAVTPGRSVIVLLQNGLNIEKPLLAAFPDNIVLSGVSFCGSHETSPGHIVHEDDDELYIGAFRNPARTVKDEAAAARDFCRIYAAGGKCSAEYKPDVGWTRWRKLVYNACLNSICAITDLDTGRIQLADGALDGLVRPAMEEIRAAAAACGHDLPAELVETMIRLDPIPMYNPPSMQVDIRKRRYCEFENVVGEPLKEGTARGVPMPTLTVIYHLLRCSQWKIKEERGAVTIPEPHDFTNTTNGEELKTLPNGDILIQAGDFTKDGLFDEIQEGIVMWLLSQFDAIVYATTGTDLERITTPDKHAESKVPLCPSRRVKSILEIVQGLADLHRIGVVHGHLHLGNLALSTPTREDLERLLEKPPEEHQVLRKDGRPTPMKLPQLVTELEDIWLGDGHCQLFDFGYSFQSSPEALYSAENFAKAVPLPPELLGPDKKTTQPFKFDSWNLGQLVYFILTDGCSLLELGLGQPDENPAASQQEDIVTRKTPPFNSPRTPPG